MNTHTFSTDTDTWQMRTIKWLFIASGLLILASQIPSVLSGKEVNVAAVVVGLCILPQGLFFDYYFKNIELTIGDDTIHYHRFKQVLRSEKELSIRWQDVNKIRLTNWTLKIIVMDNIDLKFKLPNYTTRQFEEMKKLLREHSQARGIQFEVTSWW